MAAATAALAASPVTAMVMTMAGSASAAAAAPPLPWATSMGGVAATVVAGGDGDATAVAAAATAVVCAFLHHPPGCAATADYAGAGGACPPQPAFIDVASVMAAAAVPAAAVGLSPAAARLLRIDVGEVSVVDGGGAVAVVLHRVNVGVRGGGGGWVNAGAVVPFGGARPDEG